MKTRKGAVPESPNGRWIVLMACVAAMLSIANLQYAWTMFTVPLTKALGASLTAVQVAFTLFVLAQTWGQPVEAWLVEKFGPRAMLSFAGFLVALSWVGSGLAQSLPILYLSYALGGIGAGLVYGACIGMATKWFPDRRGLVVGVVAGSYGLGTALTILPVENMINTSGYQTAFITWGLIQGAVVLLAAQFVRFPAANWKPAGWNPIAAAGPKKVFVSSRGYTPKEMLKTPAFYVMYVMMTMLAFGGMLVTAQLKPIGHAYGYDKSILFGTVTVLTLALLFEQLSNGLTRPFWGWVSDKIGRYNAMAISFTIEAAGIAMMAATVSSPGWFMAMAPLAAFAWGNIYSLFPSATADVFGVKNATKNYGILYTSKGFSAILGGPVAAALQALTGSWVPVLLMVAVCDLIVAGLAFFWLKPMVARMMAEQEAAANLQAAGD